MSVKKQRKTHNVNTDTTDKVEILSTKDTTEKEGDVNNGNRLYRKEEEVKKDIEKDEVDIKEFELDTKIPAMKNYLTFKEAASYLGIKSNRFVELTRNGSLTIFWNSTGYVVRADEVMRLKKSIKA